MFLSMLLGGSAQIENSGVSLIAQAQTSACPAPGGSQYASSPSGAKSGYVSASVGPCEFRCNEFRVEPHWARASASGFVSATPTELYMGFCISADAYGPCATTLSGAQYQGSCAFTLNEDTTITWDTHSDVSGGGGAGGGSELPPECSLDSVPRLPDIVETDNTPPGSPASVFVWTDAPSGEWFAVPNIGPGVRFKTRDGSLFTEILDFPCVGSFVLEVDGLSYGPFAHGQTFNFSGLLGSGVSEFSVLPQGNTLLAMLPLPVAFDSLTADFEARVFGPNTAPLVSTPIANQSVSYGTAFSFIVPVNTFTDADAAQALTYSATGLPAWLSFDPTTRTFSGTPATVGSSTITVTATDNGSPALSASTSFDIVVGKAVLTATADTLTRFYGEENPPLTGTLSGVVNGDNISASYSTTATPTSGTGVYTIFVTLNDPDNRLGNYTVTTVTGGLYVNPAPQTIVLDPIPVHTYGDGPFTVNAVASSGLPVTVWTWNPTVATVSGNTVTILSAGTTTVAARQDGNANYQAADFVLQTLTVNKATPIVTWADPADINCQTHLGSGQLNATANVAGTFAYSPPEGTSLGIGSGQLLTANFTPSDSLNYETTSAAVAIAVRLDAVAEVWIQLHNGPNNLYDEALAMAVDDSGNVAVTGYSVGADSNYDYYTAKYAEADGALLWERGYNGAANDRDEASALVVDSVGNVIVTGYSYGNASGPDWYTAKYAAADGGLLWEQRYSSTGVNPDYARAVAVDASGNVLVTGDSGAGCATVKYAASDGAILWMAHHAGPAQANALAVTHSGDVVAVGTLWNGSNYDFFVAKYAAVDGVLLWESQYSGQGEGPDGAYSVAVDDSGNVVACGYSFGAMTGADYYTAKFAAVDGSLLWEKRYNGPANSDDVPFDLALDGSGNAMVTGYSYGAGSDVYTAKYAALDGTMLWEVRYDGPASSDDRATALALDVNGNVVVTGLSTGDSGMTDYYTAKYSAANGTVLWEKRYNVTYNGDSSGQARAVAILPNGGVAIAGHVNSSASGLDFATVLYRSGQPPRVTLNGVDAMTLPYGGTFTDPGATAVDGCGATLSVNVNGAVNVLAPGIYTRTYSAVDSAGQTASITRSITVTPGNVPPTASDQVIEAYEDNSHSFRLAGSDADGDTLTFLVTVLPEHGQLVRSAGSPDCLYFPAENYHGPDSITYAVSDGHGGTATGTVSITVNAVNDPPIAQSQSVLCRDGLPIGITLTATDYDLDAITYSVTALPTHGSLTGTPPDLTYTPAAGYRGHDSFTYSADDGQGGMSSATVSINVGVRSPVWVGESSDDPQNFKGVGVGTDRFGNVYTVGNLFGAVVLTKFDPAGAKLWQTIYSSGGSPTATAVVVDSGGNPYVIGRSSVYDPVLEQNRDVRLVVKYDPSGNQLWAKEWNGVTSPANDLASPRLDANNNLLVLVASGGGISKLDPAGNELWVGGPGGSLRALTLDVAGNVYVCGTRNGLLTAKFSANGSEIWTAEYTSLSADMIEANAIAVDAMGNVAVTGAMVDGTTDADLITVKYDANGNQLWTAAYNNPSDGSDIGRSIAFDSDGNVHVAGTAYDWQVVLGGMVFWDGAITLRSLDSDQFGYPAHALVLAYNSSGQLIAQAIGFGNPIDYTYGQAVGFDAAGRASISGTEYDSASRLGIITAGYDSSGTMLWKGLYRSPDGAPAYLVGQNIGIDSTTTVLSQAGSVIRYPAELALFGVTPASAIANSPGLSLTVNGAGFDSTTVVFWNGAARPTTFVNSGQVVAQISDAELQATGELTAARITVANASGVSSSPIAFTITSPNVSVAQSQIAVAGQTVAVSVAPHSAGAAGVAAGVNNLGDPTDVTVTVAAYSDNPTSATAFDAGGGFVDLRIVGADENDLAAAAFYYPSTVTGSTEAALQLLYFNGADWAPVHNSGDTEPAKDTTDNLEGTVSGGRFSVTFDNTSTPKITELSGTVFTATVIEPPQITTQPQSLSVPAGESATFSVVATGGEPLSYQWMRDGVEMNGLNADTLILPNVNVLDTAAYSVRISNSAGQVVSQPATLSVSKRTPVVTWPAPSGIVYGTPLGTAQLNASADVPGTFDYTPGLGTALLAGNSQVLSVTFTPSDPDRYESVVASVAINVTKAPLTLQADNLTKVYGGPLPTLTASYVGLVNGDTAASLSSQPALATTATSASTAGNYPITISGGSAANYTITLVPGTLTVTKAPLTVTADDKSKVYGAALPTLTLAYSGFVNGDTAASLSSRPTMSTTAVKASPASVYPITLTGGAGANYNITLVPGTLTVTAASLTITAQNRTKVYGNAVPTLTVSYSGFVNGDNATDLDTPVSLSTTAMTNSPVGTYPIVASGASDANYTISFVNATLTITPRNLTITAQNKTKVYGAALPALTAGYSGLAPGETAADIDVPAVVTTSATPASNVGTYPIAINGATDPNYTITLVNGTLTVNKASLTVRATNRSKTYGATPPALAYTITGLVNGDTEASLDTPVAITTAADLNSPVATYPIVVSGASDTNYSVTFANGTLTVSKAPLTIKAENVTKVYGAALPAMPVTYTGFVLGESASVLTAAPSVTTTATPSSNAGNYPITVNGATAANYAVTFQNGTLAVSKAPLTITADDKTKTQGTVNPAFTASYAGFVNGDTVASLDTAVSFSTTAKTTSPVGSYPITPKSAKDANYTVTFVNGTLTITP